MNPLERAKQGLIEHEKRIRLQAAAEGGLDPMAAIGKEGDRLIRAGTREISEKGLSGGIQGIKDGTQRVLNRGFSELKSGRPVSGAGAVVREGIAGMGGRAVDAVKREVAERGVIKGSGRIAGRALKHLGPAGLAFDAGMGLMQGESVGKAASTALGGGVGWLAGAGAASAAGLSGAKIGASLGGLIGSVPGAAVGSLIGGAIGVGAGMAGGYAGDKIAGKIYDSAFGAEPVDAGVQPEGGSAFPAPISSVQTGGPYELTDPGTLNLVQGAPTAEPDPRMMRGY